MDLKLVKEILDKYDAKSTPVIRGNLTYSYEDLVSYLKDLDEVAVRLRGFTIKSELSRRRALIVILQELYFDKSSYSDLKINFKEIEDEAKKRFEYLNRNKGKFNSAEKTHPKNPSKYYGNNTKSLRHYREAIELLAKMSDFYIDGEEAGENLLKLYHNIET